MAFSEDPHVQRALTDQNPWHGPGTVPDELARTVERPIVAPLTSRLLDGTRARRFSMILGPRRVGKTTAMYQCVRRLLAAGVAPGSVFWLRLDHPMLLRFDLGTLVRWIVETTAATRGRPVFLFLDELTYAKDWRLWLKTFFDEAWPVRVVATSSATAALRGPDKESGIGRWDEIYLPPYSFPEFLSLAGVGNPVMAGGTLAETLITACDTPMPAGLERRRTQFAVAGGFPELLVAMTTPEGETISEETLVLRSQDILRRDAIERAIYKDIPQAFNIAQPETLERLLYILAGQVSGILSPAKICQQLDGLSQPTFDRYLTYLESAFLVFTLPNHTGGELARQARGRKVYFIDGAVRDAALLRGLGAWRDSAEAGHLLENLVAAHTRTAAEQAGVRLFHRRRGDSEIDLVYDQPERPLALKIGRSATHPVDALRTLAAEQRRFEGGLWLVSPDIPRSLKPAVAGAVGRISLNAFLFAAGAQSARDLDRRLK